MGLATFSIIYLVAIFLILMIFIGNELLSIFSVAMPQILESGFGLLGILVKICAILIAARVVLGILEVAFEKQRERLVENLHMKNIQIDLLKEGSRWGVWIIALMLVLTALNLQNMVTTFLASAGIIGIIVAFATQSLLQSFLAGIAISMDRSFEVGDSVKIGDITGKVDKIKMRTTRVKTWDGSTVIIPNSKVMDSIITNWSKARIRRMNIKLEVEKKSYNKALKVLRKELPKLDFIAENTEAEILEGGYKTDLNSKIQMGTVNIQVWADTSVFWPKLRWMLDHIDKLMTKNKITYYNLINE